MPNLVTIIFAILVAPSKSLDAPVIHSKREKIETKAQFITYQVSVMLHSRIGTPSLIPKWENFKNFFIIFHLIQDRHFEVFTVLNTLFHTQGVLVKFIYYYMVSLRMFV